MRRTIASVTTPSRWRRRRAARVAVAGALVIAAPFVGNPGSTDPVEAATLNDQTGDTKSEAQHGDSPGSTTGSAGTPDEREPLRIVPVPLADPAVADLLRPGDLVDLVGTADTAGTAITAHPPAPDEPPDAAPEAGPVLVARAARVRETPAGQSGSRSILVEVPEVDAAHLAATAAGTPLAVVVHG